ncbi:MAG: hypothetical protein ACI8ZF_001012 [Candidatus Midichloriaceae bacterium]|jgi:hypothetical protein
MLNLLQLVLGKMHLLFLKINRALKIKRRVGSVIRFVFKQQMDKAKFFYKKVVLCQL